MLPLDYLPPGGERGSPSRQPKRRSEERENWISTDLDFVKNPFKRKNYKNLRDPTKNYDHIL